MQTLQDRGIGPWRGFWAICQQDSDFRSVFLAPHSPHPTADLVIPNYLQVPNVVIRMPVRQVFLALMPQVKNVKFSAVD